MDEVVWLPPFPIVGATARVEAHEIRFDGTLALNFKQAEICELHIKIWTQEQAAHARNRKPVLEALLGKELAKRAPDPFQTQIDAILSSWRQSGRPKDLFDLIGLGSGSTPSGDDLVVGMLAACSALGTTTLALALGTAEIRQRTHPVSAQMIEAAIDGAFSQSLGDLASQLGQAASTEELLRQCVETIADQGANSGIAMLVGFTTAYSWQSKT